MLPHVYMYQSHIDSQLSPGQKIVPVLAYAVWYISQKVLNVCENFRFQATLDDLSFRLHLIIDSYMNVVCFHRWLLCD